jgi:hypothetical protein
MDRRLTTLFERQRANGFAGLTGSEAHAVIRVSADLLDEAVGLFASSARAVREISVRPRAGNSIDVRLKLAQTFVPSLNLTLAIEQQPQLPATPELVLRITGAGGMLRFAAPAISSFGNLPPGMRLDGDRLFVDLRALLAHHGHRELLNYAEQLEVVTEEGTLIVLAQLRVR